MCLLGQARYPKTQKRGKRCEGPRRSTAPLWWYIHPAPEALWRQSCSSQSERPAFGTWWPSGTVPAAEPTGRCTPKSGFSERLLSLLLEHRYCAFAQTRYNTTCTNKWPPRLNVCENMYVCARMHANPTDSYRDTQDISTGVTSQVSLRFIPGRVVFFMCAWLCARIAMIFLQSCYRVVHDLVDVAPSPVGRVKSQNMFRVIVIMLCKNYSTTSPWCRVA